MLTLVPFHFLNCNNIALIQSKSQFKPPFPLALIDQYYMIGDLYQLHNSLETSRLRFLICDYGFLILFMLILPIFISVKMVNSRSYLQYYLVISKCQHRSIKCVKRPNIQL